MVSLNFNQHFIQRCSSAYVLIEIRFLKFLKIAVYCSFMIRTRNNPRINNYSKNIFFYYQNLYVLNLLLLLSINFLNEK